MEDRRLPSGFSTFLGGSAGGDTEGGIDIARDTNGNLYVAGHTPSVDFPTTPGAYDRSYNGGVWWGDAFVAKLDASGNVQWATYLGGSGDDWGRGIAVDADGNVYVTGETTSTDFPHTVGPPLNGGRDAFLVKFNTNGALLYATNLGGSGLDEASGVTYFHDDLQDKDFLFVVGQTHSADFPTSANAFQRSYSGPRSDIWDVFVTKVNAATGDMLASTYLGGQKADQSGRVAVDADGYPYVSGNTLSGNFPVTPGAYQTTNYGAHDIFVTKLDPNLSSLVYSTYLGGTSSDVGWSIALDSDRNVYLTGYTSSTDFPTTPGAFQTFAFPGGDAFVTKLNPTGSALVYSTYVGGSARDVGIGIAVDADKNAYIAGPTSSEDFPTTAGAVHGDYTGAFVAKFTPDGSGMAYSTYWGNPVGPSSYAAAYAIVADNTGNTYVVGQAFHDITTFVDALVTGFPATSSEPPLMRRGLFIMDASGREGSKLVFTVYLNVPSGTGLVTVDYETRNYYSAVAGSDYKAVSGRLSFAPGETSKTITVQTLQDKIGEWDEFFLVTLSNPVNAVLGRDVGIGTIWDDDKPPPPPPPGEWAGSTSLAAVWPPVAGTLAVVAPGPSGSQLTSSTAESTSTTTRSTANPDVLDEVFGKLTNQESLGLDGFGPILWDAIREPWMDFLPIEARLLDRVSSSVVGK